MHGIGINVYISRTELTVPYKKMKDDIRDARKKNASYFVFGVAFRKIETMKFMPTNVVKPQ